MTVDHLLAIGWGAPLAVIAIGGCIAMIQDARGKKRRRRGTGRLLDGVTHDEVPE